MKVLYIHELYPPELVGGGEIYAENLVTELKKRKIDVMVVTGTKGKTRIQIRNGIKIKRIHFDTRRQFMFKSKEIGKVIQEFKPDIVHSNAFTACIPSYFAAKKHKIPHVVNLHFLFLEEYFRYHNPFKAALFAFMERFLLRGSKKVKKFIALSPEIYTNLVKLGYKDRTLLIDHPINTKQFKPTKKPKKFTIGTTITLEPSKRIDLFIDLAKTMKNVNFLIIGPYTKYMKEQFDRHGIKYTGRIPHKEMQKYYNKMHVYFGHGMAAKEAMSCGCVAILNESTQRLLGYHNKELKNKTMLKGNSSNIIDRLKGNKKYYNSQSKKSRKFIKDNYSTEIIIPKIINLYKKLIK